MREPRRRRGPSSPYTPPPMRGSREQNTAQVQHTVASSQGGLETDQWGDYGVLRWSTRRLTSLKLGVLESNFTLTAFPLLGDEQTQPVTEDDLKPDSERPLEVLKDEARKRAIVTLGAGTLAVATEVGAAGGLTRFVVRAINQSDEDTYAVSLGLIVEHSVSGKKLPTCIGEAYRLDAMDTRTPLEPNPEIWIGELGESHVLGLRRNCYLACH